MTHAHVITRASLQDDTLRRMMAASAPGLRLLTDDERAASLAATLADRPDNGQGVWLFADGFLIWNPALRYGARRLARIHGWHRNPCCAGPGPSEWPGQVGLEPT